MVSIPHYVNFLVDPTGDNYTIPMSDLMEGTRVIRKVNNPSAFEFTIHSPAGARIALYEMDDTVDVHLGDEPLGDWGSLSALILDGTNDDVKVVHHASLDFGAATDFSVAFRFKVSAFGAGKHEICSKADGVPPQWRVFMENDGSLECRLHDGVNLAQVISATGFDDGQWHTGLVTLDRDGNGQWYIGGIASGSAVSLATVGDIDDGDDLYIGSYHTAGSWFTGKLDEIAIWNEVVSSADITSYEGGTVNVTNLVAYWDFDEGYGSSATDESTNTNTGAIRSGGVAATDRWVNPKVMTGLLSEIEIQRPARGRNLLTGRGEDYLTVLAYRLARAGFQGSQSFSTMLSDLFTEFASGEFTTTNVDTTINGATVTVTDFTVGTQKSILNIMRELAELPSGDSFDFYLDGGNDLNWHQRGYTTWSSGVTLNENNIRGFTSRRSTKDKKTVIHLRGSQTPIEDTSLTHNTITDSVTLETNHYADDFTAEHDNLMKIELYIQKVGTPGTDLIGRISTARYDGPGGDFKAFSVREEDISTTAGWYTIPIGIPLQIDKRYFIKLDKVGSDAANTYKWYGDTPAVLDTENKARLSPTALKWTESDYDFSMRLHFGEYTEITATDAATPKREAVVQARAAMDDTVGQALANRLLVNYLQTQWFASLNVDCPSVELKPGDLITLNEAGSGLASKTYRMETIRWDFGARGKADNVTLDISSVLPYEDNAEIMSRIMELLVGGTGSQMQSGDTEGAEPDRVGPSTISRSLVAYDPEL